MYPKKSVIVLVLTLIVFALSAASFPPDDERPTNLKVLPKDISEEALDDIMNGFKISLGVKCGFCHEPQAGNPKKLDFASDAKPEKETTRAMMRMTAKLNKKYFGHEKDKAGNPVLMVSCFTCHNGKEKPESKIPIPVKPPKK